jgi:predicted lipoprotein with Yx(FWY)xxD motif
MIRGRSARAGAIVAIAAVGAFGYALPSLAASSEAPVATPPGITLQALGTGQGSAMAFSLTQVPRTQIAFADAKGMTLYTYDKDSPGKSRCEDACTKFWPPALAPRSARAVGDWSIFKRSDGTRQWQYRGKPVYTFVRDTEVGSAFGKSPNQAFFPRPGGRGPAKTQQPAGWNLALLYPLSDVAMPEGIGTREVGDANGLAFIDESGKTIYAFEGRGGEKALVQLSDQWTPLVAPALARPVGQWAVLTREDGIQQWTYRGRPLFTYAGDLAPGDANGVGISKDWDAALAVSFYLPAHVRLEQTLGRGKVLADQNGLTLYRRDGIAIDYGGGQSARHGVPLYPGVGRSIGVSLKGCEGACLTVWHPFVAPADAQPDGFWSVATRPDGVHQWVYQGYALYTFSGDQKPGDMNGNDIFNAVLSDNPNQLNDVGTPMTGTANLYWTIAYPTFN